MANFDTKQRVVGRVPLQSLTEEYELHTFPNGIRLAHKHVTNTRIAHAVIMLDVGSRDDTPEQQGLAHVWQHMAYKGTEKRPSHHPFTSLERGGGELKPYAT